MWNVLKTIYPIQPEIVQAFKNKQNALGVRTEGQEGNWREIQTGFNIDVIYVS